MSKFQKATAAQLYLRMALLGPPGVGKTWTALTIAEWLCGGPEVYTENDIAVIDSERGSAKKYAKRRNMKRGAGNWEFGHLDLETHNPQQYIDAIHDAEQSGFKVCIIDSLSHAWVGKDGALEMVDSITKRKNLNSNFFAWRDVTPLHNQLVDTIMSARMHMILTMRVKMEHVVEKDEKGKTTIRKVGLAPLMREGVEYETDIVADMDSDNNLMVTKTRCPALNGKVFRKPGREFAMLVNNWLNDGDTEPAPRFTPASNQTQSPQPATATPPTGNSNGSAAPKLPANGVALLKMIETVDATLAKSGKAKAGAFLARVKQAGVEDGMTDDIAGWPASVMEHAVKLCKHLREQIDHEYQESLAQEAAAASNLGDAAE